MDKEMQAKINKSGLLEESINNLKHMADLRDLKVRRNSKVEIARAIVEDEERKNKA